MKRRSGAPAEWIPVTSADGLNQGLYRVSGGVLTVRLGRREKSTRASSTGVPTTQGTGTADEALAKVMLLELSENQINRN